MKAHVFRNPNNADWVTVMMQEGNFLVVLSNSWTEAVRVAVGTEPIDVSRSSLGAALLHNLPVTASNSTASRAL